jgi:hypothetical protein
MLFKHALVQDTAHSTLLRGPRQALHRRNSGFGLRRNPPGVVAHRTAKPADKAIAWHRAAGVGARSAVHEAIAQLRRGLSLLDGLPETRERNQLELDIPLTQALMAGKGYADLKPSPRWSSEPARDRDRVSRDPGPFLVLSGLWASNPTRGRLRPGANTTNFLSFAQSQPSSGPLWLPSPSLSLMERRLPCSPRAFRNGRVVVGLATRDDAFHYGGRSVSAFVHLSLALWHRGYPDQSARAADRALALSRQLGHAHTLAYAFWFAGMAAVFARDVATVCARGDDCMALASEHGFPLWAAGGRILQGWADAQRGEATTGIVRIRDGMAAAEATGTRVTAPLFLTLLAEVT